MSQYKFKQLPLGGSPQPLKIDTWVNTQEGQRSNWCKYAENAYKYNHFFHLSSFANLIMSETIVNRHSAMQRAKDVINLCLK